MSTKDHFECSRFPIHRLTLDNFVTAKETPDTLSKPPNTIERSVTINSLDALYTLRERAGAALASPFRGQKLIFSDLYLTF
jgi:hypothetical protein